MSVGHPAKAGTSLTGTGRAARFDDLLLESIDYTIRGTLGEQPWRALFDCLEQQFHLRREDVPERLQDFTDALARIFGGAAPVMTRAIVRDFCGRLGISYVERKNLDFKTYVEDCRRRYEGLSGDVWS